MDGPYSVVDHITRFYNNTASNIDANVGTAVALTSFPGNVSQPDHGQWSDAHGRTDTLHWGSLLLGLVVVFGITGNTLVCLAISLERRLQTVTNYFLLSLAITDLLVCSLVMPMAILNQFYGELGFI